MAHTLEEMRPARLWRQMPLEQRQAAAAAFWDDEQAALEQAEAVALIARQIKFRPKSVLTLAVEKKARHLAKMAQVSDLLAARLLVSYHLAFQRPMMGAFLDALGIAHEDGLIKDDAPTAPDAAALDAAVATLAAAYPPGDVGRYFWTLLWQDPKTWSGLEGRPELQLP
ncbi:MAG: hypothetical protein OEW19_19535 [Acidobacteriota bacterium]|nr:hypothetical protein [Acidobacteriota bacterium]